MPYGNIFPLNASAGCFYFIFVLRIESELGLRHLFALFDFDDFHRRYCKLLKLFEIGPEDNFSYFFFYVYGF